MMETNKENTIYATYKGVFLIHDNEHFITKELYNNLKKAGEITIPEEEIEWFEFPPLSDD